MLCPQIVSLWQGSCGSQGLSPSQQTIAILLLKVFLTEAEALASPVVMVTFPPVLLLASLFPVLAPAKTKLLTLALLLWRTVTFLVDFTFTLLVLSFPFPEMTIELPAYTGATKERSSAPAAIAETVLLIICIIFTTDLGF